MVTEENWAEVAPRFFGLSAREAREVVAALQPRAAPPLRAVVTSLHTQQLELVRPQAAALPPMANPVEPSPSAPSTPALTLALSAAPTTGEDSNVVLLWRFPTSGIAFGGGDEIVPLTANVRRVHFNVDKHVVRKLKAAREGLSHSIRGATMEQVLEAALDLLLEKQARARALVKRPRAVRPTPTSTSTPTATEPPPHRRSGPRAAIPATVRRAVWEGDAGRRSWPLDGGGCCGSTHRLELDHLIPWAEWGPDTVENLRVVCGRHNALAARGAFGEPQMSRYAGRRTGGSGSSASHHPRP